MADLLLHPLRSMSALAFACFFLSPLARAGDVLVVDSGGGGDHTTIQAAADAAADGDVLLVKPGTYPAFYVSGKGLSVIADGGVVDVQAPGVQLSVTNEDQVIVLAGLHAQGVKILGGMYPALMVADTEGALRVEDCTFLGGDGDETNCEDYGCPGTQERGGEAVVLFRALDASFARCTIQGGEGVNCLLNSTNGGGHGVDAVGSRVSFHDSVVRGGNGGGQCDIPDLADGGPGGHGIEAQDNAQSIMIVHLAGTSVTGGGGGDGRTCIGR